MDRWYSSDKLRQSWYLLTITTDSVSGEEFITACEIGEGNQDQLIEKAQLTAENPDEEDELLQELCAVLDNIRYDGVTLITPSRDELAVLRTRLLNCTQIQQPTLRGFRHVAVIEVLTQYFTDECRDPLLNLRTEHHINSENASREKHPLNSAGISVTELWEVRTAIGPLVPPESLRGTPL